MFLLKSLRQSYRGYKLSYCVFRQTFRRIGHKTASNNLDVCNKEIGDSNLRDLIEKYESKILFNSTIEDSKPKLHYQQNRAAIVKRQQFKDKMEQVIQTIQPLPLSLRYLSKESNVHKHENEPELVKNVDGVERQIQFPYDKNYSIENVEENLETEKEITINIDEEIRQKNRDMNNWMKSYDNFENDLNDEEFDDSNLESTVNYGTPDPTIKVSNVPCGGCGAYLHCKDTAIPGYIPSEIFKNHDMKGAASLESIICQRCYFLKEYNMALQVRVSPEDYPKILTTIRDKRALVVLMVDLIDFPCSIWPGIADILGPNTPVYIVGNKVDLLPKDCDKFLTNIKRRLLENIKINGFGSSNILGVSLISAKTNYGIEDVISALGRLWRYKGDVYLVGCTNVGKSSLFNTLLQSDYCKIQATDLIQRATVSQWPGTTLNLLKFPITRLAGYRLMLRHQRLSAIRSLEIEQTKLRDEKLIKNTVKDATLIGHIGQSFTRTMEVDQEEKDCFSVQGHDNASGKSKMGINIKNPDFATCKWCYDTPGVVQPDQIINLLTVEELVLTIPKQLIRAQTFCIRPGTSLFIAGLARLDYLNGPQSVRFTVFRSNNLPITVCPLEEADEIYENLLGTELFRVPINEGDRLSKWPGLEPHKVFTIKGTHWKYSSKDVVLSSAGWVSINCGQDLDFEFRGWTPEKRGFYIRECLLPKAVTLRGSRISRSIAYKVHKLI